ncbi:family 43 glycosylhydrolase [Aestuariimicrobium soli]|uniref:family 43 glycosylhydrolase n=1 Tax=Aestuariimicrobium soli TaxID=2035834 RepID=UPI003EBB9C96
MQPPVLFTPKKGLAALALSFCLGVAALGSSVPGAVADTTARTSAGTYTNAVSDSFADTYADPMLIQGKDGWYYAYATADPLKAGSPSGIGHIARTRDFASWEYVGEIFSDANWPSWAERSSFLWAPDVRYIGGQYVMYFTVTDTRAEAGSWDPAIGVATAPTPAGPWTPTDAPVVAPRWNPDSKNWFNTIDPAGFTDTNGDNYLYFGNYYGGTHVTRLSADGLTAVGETTQVGANDRYEGSWVTEHDGWYYLMGSSANCCAGPATGYSVFAGRSRSPMGPFVDADGLELTASNTGGTLVVTQNGNRFIGPGHNGSFRDLAGRDFLVYHGLPRDDPWLTNPTGINQRPMLIDRIDWVDGWPRVNAGGGPSDTAQPLPVTGSMLRGQVDDPTTTLSGATRGTDALGGAVAVVNGRATSLDRLPGGNLELRLDLKGTEPPLSVTVGKPGKQSTVTVSASSLTVQTPGQAGSSDDLAPADHWRTLRITLDKKVLTAEVADSDLGDPRARVVVADQAIDSAAAPLVLGGAGMVDNLSVNRLAVEATTLTPQPVAAGEPLLSEQFSGSGDGTAVGPQWSWVRPDAAVSVGDGALNFPLRAVDVAGTTNNGALLLTTPPTSTDWIFETKVNLDLGENEFRNYQQAGIIVRRSDDDFARLGTVSIWGTRTIEYGRELAVAPGDPRLIYGGAIVSSTAPTIWLRVAHHQNAAGEHLYRAATSKDGLTWTWGATWTLAAGDTPQIGLYAGGGSQHQAVARFDYATITAASAAPGTWPR